MTDAENVSQNVDQLAGAQGLALQNMQNDVSLATEITNQNGDLLEPTASAQDSISMQSGNANVSILADTNNQNHSVPSTPQHIPGTSSKIANPFMTARASMFAFDLANSSTPKAAVSCGKQAKSPPKSTSESAVVTAQLLSSVLNSVLQMEQPNNFKEEPAFDQLNNEDAQALEDVFNESYENCDTSGDDILIRKEEVVPRPIAERSKYQVKQNDIVSGNMLFATNVSLLFIFYF